MSECGAASGMSPRPDLLSHDAVFMVVTGPAGTLTDMLQHQLPSLRPILKAYAAYPQHLSCSLCKMLLEYGNDPRARFCSAPS